MKKYLAKKVVSLMLATVMGASVVPITAYAEEPESQSSPFVVGADKTGNTSMNLTEEGTIDWMHVSEDGIVRKKDVEPVINVKDVTEFYFGDSPVGVSWTDGDNIGSANGNRKGIVYKEGYNVTVEANSDKLRKLTFVSGSWRSSNTIRIGVEGNDNVYSHNRVAGGDAVSYIYTVFIQPGNKLTIDGLITGKSGDGNITLSAFALSEVEMPEIDLPDNLFEIKNAPSNMNLTEEGELDWVHMVGDNNDGKVVNRKKDVTPVIEVKARDTTSGNNKVASMHDGAVTYSWTDGSPNTTENGYRYGSVYIYKQGTANINDIATTELTGYEINVPAAKGERILQFVTGTWEATEKVSVFLNGSNTAYASDTVSGNTKLYQMIIPANQSLKVIGEYLHKGNNGDGNISLGGVALKSKAQFLVEGEPSTMNLTIEGGLDWVHMVGEHRDGKVTNRKDITPTILEVKARDTTTGNNTITALTDGTPLSWTDGTPDQSVTNYRYGAVFIYKKGQGNISNISTDELTGYEINVPASNEERMLQFITGTWEATGKVSAFLNGATTADFEQTVTARRLFKMVIPANQSLKVIGEYTSKGGNGDGNISLCAVALKVDNSFESYEEECNKLITEIEANTNLWSELAGLEDSFAESMLEKQLAYAKAILQTSGATEEDFFLAYQLLKAAYSSAKEAIATSGYYKFETNGGLVASFGWEGDRHAPYSYIDGSYLVRHNRTGPNDDQPRGHEPAITDNTMITFGVTDIPGKIKWYNAEGYLPSFISEYSKNKMDYKVENFANKVTIGGNDFVMAYSQFTVTNNSGVTRALPTVSKELIPLNDSAKNAIEIEPGQTIVRDYAIPTDRFRKDYAWPTAEEVQATGTLEKNYNEMKTYWNNRLEPLAEIVQLPDESLINAYKAGFIYTLIIRDDMIDSNGQLARQLHVGENNYDVMFDHDTIGIVAGLFTAGDFTYAKEYLATLPAKITLGDGNHYDDAKWKYSWPYALYLQNLQKSR